MTVVLEVTDLHGSVHYYRLGDQPLTIGRGYDCDIIINDEYLSARHMLLCLGEEGRVVVSDLNSENGSHAESGEGETFPLTDETILALGTRLHIGKTTIIPYAPSTPVAKARKLHHHRRDTQKLHDRLFWMLPLAALLTMSGLFSYLENANTNTAEELVGTLMATLCGVGLCAGVWALLGRLLVRQPRFFVHVGILSGIACLMILVETIKGLIIFSLESSDPPFWSPYRHINNLTAAAYIILSLMLLAAHLKQATRLSDRMRWIAASLLPGLGLLSALLIHLVKEESPSGLAARTSFMLPVNWRAADIKTDADFINALDDMEKLAIEEAGKLKD